jgi:signal transduction histidine kinase
MGTELESATEPAPRAPSGDGATWASLTDGTTAAGRRRRPPSVGRVLGRFVVANLIAVGLLLAASVWAGKAAAEDEALADARHTTDLLATLLVEPSLEDALTEGDPQAVAALDAAVRDRLAAAGVLRVKVWTPDGVVVYSDEPRLIGARFDLADDDREALQGGGTRAELSDLTRPENRYERSAGPLLEVYRQVRTPDGSPLLFEAYSSYDDATARQMDIWSRFAPISMTVLLALLAIQLPLAARMVSRLRAEQRERELLQTRALDASVEERRRIAGSLHDGIVQDVSAAALLVAGAADHLADTSGRRSRQEGADVLGEAATALRGSAGSLRSLLVEIYPPDLQRAGLASALGDLAARLRPRGIDVRIGVPDELDVPPETATLLFRTAQETLLNVAKHAGARVVEVTVTAAADRVVLDVADDGIGFDLAEALGSPRSGHLGLSVLTDLAEAGGATLEVRTAPGAGTHVRLEVPRS